MKERLIAVLTEALARENPYTFDEDGKRLVYTCVECGSASPYGPHGGCVAGDCWVESAEMLLAQLRSTSASPAGGGKTEP